MDKILGTKEGKPVDYFRDTYIRYLGYANEVGESFRPIISKRLVHLSYGIATAYVVADAAHKSFGVYRRPIGGGVKNATITASDVFLWQMLASVIIPGFTINRITWLSTKLVKHIQFNSKVKKFLPTCIGLAAIPVIIKPIDHFVDNLMDKTYRKVFRA